MKRRTKTIALATIFAAGVWAAFADPVILSSEDGRVWQTVFDPSAPLEWRWCADAASATVTVTNALFGTVGTPIAVTRAANAKYGSVAMPNPERSADTGEGLVDVVLVQKDAGGNELQTETARLAFLPGVAGGTFEINTRPAMSSPRVASYDASWTNAAVSSIGCTFTPRDGSPLDIPLVGLGGYFPLAPAYGMAELDFDGATYATATLKKMRSIMISFK